MILASAMRHSVGRHGNGGRCEAYGVALPMNIRYETEKSVPLNGTDFVAERERWKMFGAYANLTSCSQENRWAWNSSVFLAAGLGYRSGSTMGE